MSRLAALWVHVPAQENVHMTHKDPALVYYYCPVILVIRGHLKLVQHRARLKIGLGICHARNTPPTLRKISSLVAFRVE